MLLDERKLLTDIQVAVSSIDDHLQHKRDFALYCKDKTMRRAVERELEIIGEAVSKLLKINPGIAISYARLIIDLRNKVIHAYDSVNDTVVWKVIMKDLPVLKSEVTVLLQS